MRASSLVEFAVLVPAALKRLRLLAAIAINGDCLQAELPRLEVGFHDVFHAGVLGKIDGLRDGAGDEGLRGGHHAEVSHIGDGACALRGLEGAIEDGEMLVLDMRRAFNGAGGVDVADDGVGLLVGVAELEQGGGDGVVDDFNHAAADQLLVLDQGEIGLDAGGVAVHHEADGSGWGEDCDLGISVAVFFAVGEGFVPALFAGFVDAGRDVCFVDAIHAARCMRITSRKGSRLMYQPGQAPPGMVCAAGALPCASLRVAGRTNASVPTCATPAPRFVSDKFFLVASVAGTRGSHCSAILELCR